MLKDGLAVVITGGVRRIPISLAEEYSPAPSCLIRIQIGAHVRAVTYSVYC